MTFPEALAWWYGRIDFERKTPDPNDLKLDRMRAVLRSLGDPQERFRIVHVAGTKGKGSTAAMLASVLQAAGYRVGLFTSPHLSDVSERIQVNGVPITRDEMAARLSEIAHAVEAMDPPTFFEVGTALGFAHFDCRRVNVAIIEVGLGGRFDSTNVCSPVVSLITNISFDHMALLGNSLALIAFEKAGIIKRGRPVVTTAEAPEAMAVIDRIARERQAPLVALGRDFHVKYHPAVFNELSRVDDLVLPRVEVTTKERTWPPAPLGLYGSHQAANAAGVVAVVEELRHLGMPITDAAVVRGLAEVSWPARLEVVAARPLVILDCAHNVASAKTLVDTIHETFQVTGRKRLILAISTDKQVAEMMRVLAPCFDHFYLTRYTNNPRCLAPERIGEMLTAIDAAIPFSIHPQPTEALSIAQTATGPNDLLAISGSVFLAGELRPLLVVG